MNMTENPQATLDARGLNCPLPILRTRKALAALEHGDLLEMLATDPGSLKDIESFCQQTGHRLLETRSDAGEFRFLIRKS
jgi:tRNA 2-thiouridine synthesizing protein A